MARARTSKAPQPEAPPARVLVRWIEPTAANPALLDNEPRWLDPGDTTEVTASTAAELADNPSFQVPAGDWSAPEPKPEPAAVFKAAGRKAAQVADELAAAANEQTPSSEGDDANGDTTDQPANGPQED